MSTQVSMKTYEIYISYHKHFLMENFTLSIIINLSIIIEYTRHLSDHWHTSSSKYLFQFRQVLSDYLFW